MESKGEGGEELKKREGRSRSPEPRDMSGVTHAAPAGDKPQTDGTKSEN